MSRPPLPPFTRETAILKVRAAEDGRRIMPALEYHL
jgi:nuclear transport factor 2 (NTF2) superfamily protein